MTSNNSIHSGDPSKILRNLLLGSLFLAAFGLLPIVSDIFTLDFLPSRDWIEQIWWLAFGVGIFTGALHFLMMIRAESRRKKAGDSSKEMADPLGFFVTLLVGPFLIGGMNFSGVLYGVPMLYTSVLGAQGERSYTVAASEGFRDRNCMHAIRLTDGTSVYRRLCGFSEEFRQSLFPGMSLIVSGRSSPVGIYVSDVRSRN